MQVIKFVRGLHPSEDINGLVPGCQVLEKGDFGLPLQGDFGLMPGYLRKFQALQPKGLLKANLYVKDIHAGL